MKIRVRRSHTVRPENYEAVGLVAEIEIDSTEESDKEWFLNEDGEEAHLKHVGQELAEQLDFLLDTDVDRTLRLDGQHINDTHLWVFYGRD